MEDVPTDEVHQSLETYLPQMLTQIREDVIKVMIQTHETPAIIKKLNEILLVLSDLTTNSITIINKLDMLERSNQETRCSNLALIDQVKTMISYGPRIQQVMSAPIQPSSITTSTTVDTATQNRLIIISAVMASKNLAHENEKLLRLLLTSKDEQEISKILSMLNPTRRITSADIEVLQSANYTTKASCDRIKTYLANFIPCGVVNKPAIKTCDTNPPMTINTFTIKKKVFNPLD